MFFCKVFLIKVDLFLFYWTACAKGLAYPERFL